MFGGPFFVLYVRLYVLFVVVCSLRDVYGVFVVCCALFVVCCLLVVGCQCLLIRFRFVCSFVCVVVV